MTLRTDQTDTEYNKLEQPSMFSSSWRQTNAIQCYHGNIIMRVNITKLDKENSFTQGQSIPLNHIKLLLIKSSNYFKDWTYWPKKSSCMMPYKRNCWWGSKCKINEGVRGATNNGTQSYTDKRPLLNFQSNWNSGKPVITH